MTQATFPPQPTVHKAAPGAPGAMTRNEAVRRYPYARPARSVREFGPAHEMVVVVPADYPPHAYEMSMIWPAGAVRALCGVCRGTH